MIELLCFRFLVDTLNLEATNSSINVSGLPVSMMNKTGMVRPENFTLAITDSLFPSLLKSNGIRKKSHLL